VQLYQRLLQNKLYSNSLFFDTVNFSSYRIFLERNRTSPSHKTPHPFIAVNQSASLILDISALVGIDRDGIAKMEVFDAFGRG
jgi:hypothetical protein